MNQVAARHSIAEVNPFIRVKPEHRLSLAMAALLKIGSDLSSLFKHPANPAINSSMRSSMLRAVPSLPFGQALQIDAQLLAFFVEMAALKPQSLGCLCDVLVASIELRQNSRAFKGQHPL